MIDRTSDSLRSLSDKEIDVDREKEEPSWITRGKTIRQLIQELQSFENQDLEVRISVDGGKVHKCVSLVEKRAAGATHICLLVNCEDNGTS